MIVEYTINNVRRHCAVCTKRIGKDKIIVKYDVSIDNYGNTRKWFAHIDCFIRKLGQSKKKLIATRKKNSKRLIKFKTSLTHLDIEIERYKQ